jgi:predicted SprT family Zn-dependent metalloprotease
MNLHDARCLAHDLMHQHGLAGWSFAFDRARRRFGLCQFRGKRITLSRPLTLLNTEDQVRDTILHEIAHALTPGDGHGAKWKATCRRVGAKPKRCFTDTEVVSPLQKPARYQIGCVTCDWWADRRRLTARKLVCRTCRSEIVYHDRVTQRRFRLAVVARRRIIVRVDA